MKKEIQSVIDKSLRAIKSSQREFDSGDYDYLQSKRSL
jgi:hypothetical protein